MQNEVITLFELNERIGRAILNGATQNVWVEAELSDVSCRNNGHYYMELIQKDDRGNQVAKARATIWRYNTGEIASFQATTGQAFTSGIKLKVLASATMHPLFGLSLNVTRIDPTYTMGDLELRRREILERLKKDGVLNENRSIEWDKLSLNVAVISSETAAGYGDFMHHLATHGAGFRFQTLLFPALMQGERAAQSVSEALTRIENESERWDCVVIIRGGGATSDLSAFENYELAHQVAVFPLPVIVGIGHERDVTVLDFIANKRVKTPTAAADLLVQHWDKALEELNEFSRTLSQVVKDKVSAEKMLLSYFKNNLRNYSLNATERASANLHKLVLTLGNISARTLFPAKQRLESYTDKLSMITQTQISNRRNKLQSVQALLEALSPMAVLKRGYTITMADGKVVKSRSDLPEGQREITTVFHDGKITSTVN